MDRSSPDSPARLWMILCYLAALFSACLTFAAEPLPFWTEKTTYIEGDRIFAVGISAPHSDVAQSRQEAFDRASLELMNMLQVSDLGKLTINTQRTLEVPGEKGSLVYRLLWVDAEEARALKETRGRLTRETLLRQTEQMKKLREELYPVLKDHQQAAKNLQELERQANQSADANEFRREQVRSAAGAIERRIASRSSLICDIKRSMTEAEVRALVGDPDATYGSLKIHKWRYGHSFVNFTRDRVTSLSLEPDICQ